MGQNPYSYLPVPQEMASFSNGLSWDTEDSNCLKEGVTVILPI